MLGSDGILRLGGLNLSRAALTEPFSPLVAPVVAAFVIGGLQFEPPRRLPRIGREFPNH